MARKRKKSGFVETLREGWKPPHKRAVSAGSRGMKGRKPGARLGKRAGVSRNGASPAIGEPELLRRRQELSRQFAELQWDLGGMTYEMAARDHFRLDVLAKQAAKVQQADSELGQIERMLKMEESGAAGTCPSCGALQARGAIFCWQCGHEMKPPATPGRKAAKPSRAKKK